MFNFQMRSEVTINQSSPSTITPFPRKIKFVRCLKRTVFGTFVAFLHIYLAHTEIRNSFFSVKALRHLSYGSKRYFPNGPISHRAYVSSGIKFLGAPQKNSFPNFFYGVGVQYAVSRHRGGCPRAKQYAVSRLRVWNIAGPSTIFDPMTRMPDEK